MEDKGDGGASLFPHQIVDFTPAQPVLSCRFALLRDCVLCVWISGGVLACFPASFFAILSTI